MLAEVKILGLSLVLISICHCYAQSNCNVSTFPVKENFNKTRYLGRWYAMAKKSPDSIFLEDNIYADFAQDDQGFMNATARGRVTLLENWPTCVQMLGKFLETSNPAKFKLKYRGALHYLQSGFDDHWVIDTDYDTFAITYTCRQLNDDETCADSYSLVFSRDPKGIPPGVHGIIRQRQGQICLANKYGRVRHEGLCLV
uniref:Retinol binding protein 4, plasma n=1 Tax=Callorhinchus milii TaxID=7868 RepID=K4FUW4_CALMI|nr:retinol binding protein 4, plasma [Callorhinchus milii]